ncbi:MAG: CCA tRNA nucleotidyltransferase [Sphingomonadaceae bacterium]|uniref:CCA tRNA nucleotidyltransferase n=1 Tax=Thermaurantiacus sp. TaxID=2820283 RepID=UPI00298EEA2E|nr:CCA tRNA nucleotidyltransferase [Thermaurantiacus sp.]MCS6986119.1 CCA tRNA nucleotidyltransferase [Sphingomonadaceae bacterium]MDW8414665.1 CCA tRNA nucleotidyltransferase [Thermaurantiacus sp.]
MTRLDPALWLDRPGMGKLFDALEAAADATRVVGGAVRDGLLGRPVADVDFATRLRPDDASARLRRAGIKVVPTGLSHGTITAVLAGRPYQITTLRIDAETFGRHARVVFTDDWQADAARRDFTVNAMFARALGGEVSDFYGGLEDLRRRIVRFIGEPEARIAEDSLRILRFFRFAAQLDFGMDPAGLKACAARARDLLSLSRERIREELLKLLSARDPVPATQAMLAHGILTPILPEATDLPRLARLVAAEARAEAAPHPLRRLAALLPEDPALARALGSRLRLSRKDSARLEAALTAGPVPRDPRVLAYARGAEAAIDRLLLTDDPRAPAWLPRLADWKRPQLPVSGRDLIALGLAPGPEVSRRLKAVEARWVAAGFPEDREAALALARTELETA